ncbi:Probable cationic amino acid permease [Acidilobus saccharovorans 345-15]|uniref:Probable cationic amino acid permease n=1 Tax=Acidilobus saccharovorans (strain DSM 16705 / JCM 18335 / VKM B-2471 / 345-15) TaxID=666510 RepID=D9PZ36_ACIS3|nr:APC family permease [Acidilobus saccharovorans]ADL19823.1 Probable cationic amino acid permease [Acidilobus saccharovorans 345-15]
MGSQLRRGSMPFYAMVAAVVAGVLPIIGPIEVTAFISDSGPAAIWPVIIGYVLFVLVSLPILEYTRIVSFAGGYYGLAELGFGKGAGKFTALGNYFFYNWWQAANAFFIGWLLVDTVYYAYHVMLPIWAWLLASVATLVVTYAMSVQPARRLGIAITAAVLTTLVIVVAFTAAVIARSPYNSAYYLNPANSAGGLRGLMLATAIVGFFTFAGYGTALFYSEEGVNPTRDVWKAIYVGLTVSAVAIALAAYSELVAVPRSELSQVTSSALPQLVAWSRYFPLSALVGLNFLILVVSLIAFGAGGGSQARLLWAMARDNFISSGWLKELNRHGVPANAALLDFALALATTLAVAASLVKVYGYNPNTVAVAWYVMGTASSITWYFHHFVPEFGLFPYVRRHPELGFSKLRLAVSGLAFPVLGTALFVYTFYEGVVSDLVEPYFAFMVTSLLVVVGIAAYTAYRASKGALGESVVSYMAVEAGRSKE